MQRFHSEKPEMHVSLVSRLLIVVGNKMIMPLTVPVFGKVKMKQVSIVLGIYRNLMNTVIYFFVKAL